MRRSICAMFSFLFYFLQKEWYKRLSHTHTHTHTHTRAFKQVCVFLFVAQTSWDGARDVWWDEALRDASEECEPEWLDAEDPLFILYTSGSTGKPKVPPF